MYEEMENTRILALRALKKISLFFVLVSSCVAITRFFNSSSFPPSSSSSPSSLSFEQLKSKFKHTRRLHVPKTKTDLGKLLMRSRSLQTDETAPLIGGTPAAPGRYPYFTLVLFLDSSNELQSFCGGVKIMNGVVLTAASCISPESGTPNYDSITVVMGDDMDFTSLSSLLTAPNVFESVQNVYWSATYEVITTFVFGITFPTLVLADFALLELANPIGTFPNANLNSNPAIPADGTTMKAIGFGLPGSGVGASAPRSPKLLEIDIDAQPASVCDDFFGGYSNDVNLCAQRTGQGTCLDDSGGPHIITGATPEDDVVVGLSSLGSFLCLDFSDNDPEVEARVSWFFDATTAQPMCDPMPTVGDPTSLDCFSPTPPTPSPPTPTPPTPTPGPGGFFGGLIASLLAICGSPF